ncbi:MAG: glycosyltransferase family 39 protein, partial [Promethearchaeota archaeon]
MREKKILLILALATIIKAIIIFFFYQHVIMYAGSTPKIVNGYGWDQLVSSMNHGKYEMKVQTGLSDLYELNSVSYRPPIYPAFLYLITHLCHFSAFLLIFFQSIVTSIVAYFGYKIVKLSTKKDISSLVCLGVIFFFPMNFMKSGTIDESPLSLVFLLGFIYTFCSFLRTQKKIHLILLSGVLLGFSTMTRYTTIIIAIFISFFLFFTKEIKRRRIIIIFIFTFSYILILLPWILRNYRIYGEPVLSSGSGRILLFTQSEEFIREFPYKSVDIIERNFLRRFHKSHPYLSSLNAYNLDKEFTNLALKGILNSPVKYFKSIIVKLKVFIPYRYYPYQNNVLKDIGYSFFYVFIMLFFLLALLKKKGSNLEKK